MAPEPPLGVTITYAQQYRRCGKPGCRTCREGPGHGPYWYAFWDQDGRRRSRYVGKQAPQSAGDGALLAPVANGAAPTPAAVSSMVLRVRSLGGFQVWRGSTPIEAREWRKRKVTALFKYLLCAEGNRLHREQAMEAIWPNVEPTIAARNLRYTVHLLRRVLDAPDAPASHLRTEADWLVLQPDPQGIAPDDWLDAASFAHAATQALAGQDAAACRDAMALYTGPFLPDDPYDEWACRRGAELRRLYLALLLHGALLSRAHDPVAAIQDLQALMAVEPTHETAARRLMELLVQQERRHEALHVYRDLVQALRDEMAVAPSKETEALRVRLFVPPSNLPTPVTSFVGREAEIRQLYLLCHATRLLTLVGIGGCGKTRLALEIAAGLRSEYADGVWLVDLAPLASHAQVVQALATALNIRELAGQSLQDTVGAWLKERRLLIVLDNCEHLLESCAYLASWLLALCPDLHILATSREVLGIAGEVVYAVPALSLPPDQGARAAGPESPARQPVPVLDLPVELLVQSEAVQLFAARAQARRPDFALDHHTVAAVAQICRRLDGLPLAVELAAARVGSLTVEGIAARLDDRFRLLVGGSRTASPRQQTLLAIMDWSHDLLTDRERVLFRRLAVFAGGWTLRAAEPVCADGQIAAPEVLDLLGALVNKSLVHLETQAGEERYRLLETVRQYGWDRLAAAGETALLRDRHLEWCRSLAERAEPELRGPRQVAWLARLDRDLDNVRAALRWSTQDAGRSAIGLDLASLLWRFWIVRGYLSEGRTWLDEVLQGACAAPPDLHARALAVAGRLAYYQSDYLQATMLYRESLALCREHGDLHGEATASNGLGLVLVEQGDYAAASVLLEESLALNRDLGDRWATASTLNNLGMVAHRQGKYQRAAVWLEESLALYRTVGDIQGIANTLNTWGVAALDAGNASLANALLEESLDLYRDLGGEYGMAIALSNLGMLARNARDYGRAATLLREGIILFQKLGDAGSINTCLEALALIAEAQGRPERAARLLSAAEAQRELLGAPLPTVERMEHDAAVAATWTALGEEAFAGAWAAGRTMSPERAIIFALAGASSQDQPV